MRFVYSLVRGAWVAPLVLLFACSPQRSADVASSDVGVADVRAVDVSAPDVSAPDVPAPDVRAADVSAADVRGVDVSPPLDAGSLDVQALDATPPEGLALSPLCAPLYRYQPSRSNALFKATLPGQSVGLNDFGSRGVAALGQGSTNPSLRECSGVMAPLTCAHFDGDDFYSASQTLSETQPITIAAVVSAERESWEVLSDSVAGERHRLGFDPNGNAYLQAPTTLQSEGISAAGQWNFLCAKANGDASELRLNNESVFGPAGEHAPIGVAQTQTGFKIGSTGTNQLHFNGELLEYAVYPGTCQATCEQHARAYYAHRYPQLALDSAAPNQLTCHRPQSLCPEFGECRIVVVGDSIQQGVNPGAPPPAGSWCHVAAGPDSYCTTSDQTSGLCPCDGEQARTGLVDAMLNMLNKPDCYSRMNRSRSGSLTNTWNDNQWTPIRNEVVADVGVIGGANNDWSTPSMRTCDNVQAIALDMLAVGIAKVLILGGHPQSGNDDHSAEREMKRVVENACLEAFALANDDVEFQSFDGSVVDGGGGIELSSDWGDGLHFSSVGETRAASVFVGWFE